jgi:Xaa-Pro dipeptidase
MTERVIEARIPRLPAFPEAEFRERLDRVRRGMSERGIDALALFSPASVYYLSGLENDNLWEPLCLIVTLTDNPVLALPAFERGRAVNTAWTADVVTWGRREDPAETIARLLDRTSGTTVGIEQRAPLGLTPRLYARLAERLMDHRVVDPHGIVEACRQRKSPAELAYMRVAGRITDAATEAGLAAVREGVADHEIAAEIVAAAYRAGSDMISFGPVVAIGYRAGAPHSTMNGTIARPGDTVFLELTGQQRRYAAPAMRTAHVGEPPEWAEQLAAAGVAAIDAWVGVAAPGVPLREAARAAWAHVEPVSRGLMLAGAFGYSMGIAFQPLWLEDTDYWVTTDSERTFEEGMTFHVPVALRGYGAFGVNQSQSVAITASGAELLTRTSPHMRVV